MEGCSVTVWSAVSSAMANATLAAVLAGFMITGIILVLGNTTVMKPEYVQALTLMFAAFVALGLDAFLFGIVTGESTQVTEGVTACRRAWTEAMSAAGLLGVGAVAIVVAFIVLFSAYFSDAKREGSIWEWEDSLGMLERFSGLIRGGVAVGVVAFLYVTARSYLLAIFNGHIPRLGTAFLYIYIIIAVPAVIAMAIATATKGSGNVISKFLRTDTKRQFIKALKFAIWSSISYTIISALMVAVTASISARFWNPAYPGIRVIFAVTVAWGSVISLVPLLFLLARTVPGLQRPLPDGDLKPGRPRGALKRIWRLIRTHEPSDVTNARDRLYDVQMPMSVPTLRGPLRGDPPAKPRYGWPSRGVGRDRALHMWHRVTSKAPCRR
jgi:MFS family permease